jgi:HSP20 family molecular chaperone IbpA
VRTFVPELAATPAGADEDHIQASYDMGVLEVAVMIRDQAAEEAHKRIPVMLNKHIKPT